MEPVTINAGSLRLVAVSDLRGNWDALADIVRQHKADLVLHTGNFGFWGQSTVEAATDVAYLKQIVAFSEVIPPAVVAELNDLSVISGGLGTDEKSELDDFKLKLAAPTILSQIDDYVSGHKMLPCPVYTIYSLLDDPDIVEQFLTGNVVVPNLHIVHPGAAFTVEASPATPAAAKAPLLFIYGIGGNLKVHSLFDRGSLSGHLAGKAGDLWITLPHILELYLTSQRKRENVISIFLAQSAVVKTPLLEHLAIVTGADFTISQGLHFRYPVMGNGMSFVDSMGGSAGYTENYRSKFSRLRMILGELWLVIKDEMVKILAQDPELRHMVELGLKLFDKIPVTISDSTEKIVRLLLLDDEESDEEEAELSRLALKRINDMYFAAYYNLWHFNLCDHLIARSTHEVTTAPREYNVMVFSVNEDGNFKLEHCNSQGFNFLTARVTPEAEDDDAVDDVSTSSDSFRLDGRLDASDQTSRGGRKDYRGRGRGRALRGRGQRRSRGKASPEV